MELIEGKIKLSVSRLKTLTDCEAKFTFRYRDELKIPPNAALTLGSSYDTALGVNYTQKITSKEDIPVTDVQDAFVTKFNELSIETEFGDTTPDNVKDSGVKLVTIAHKELLPSVQPIEVQKQLIVPIGNVVVEGYIDVLTEEYIVDDKTTGRTPSSMSEDYKIQLQTYQLAMVKEGKTFKAKLHYAINKKSPETKILELEEDYDEKYLRYIYSTGGEKEFAILNDLVKPLPNRRGLLCSRKWCGYWQLCESRYGGKVKD